MINAVINAATRLARVACAALAIALLAACAGTQPSDADAPIPSLDDLAVGEWSLVELRGDTRCADGSAYAIQVLPGDRDELFIVFQGGGATWGELPRAVRSTLTVISPYQRRVRAIDGDPGLASPPSDAAVAGATLVVISSCNGDVHWGDAPAGNVDDRGRSVAQVGARNVRAGLDWLADQALAPERLAIVGCSAGSYGALLWAPSLQTLFPDATRSLLLDAGIGVVQEPFVTASASPFDGIDTPYGLASWNVATAFDRNGVGALVDAIDSDFFTTLTEAVAQRFDGPIGVVSTDRDLVQALFWYLTGDDVAGFPAPAGPVPTQDEWAAIGAFAVQLTSDWSPLARARLAALDDIVGVSTFVSSWTPAGARLIDAGTGHCLTTDAALWAATGEGAELRAWWERLLDGDEPDSVDLTARGAQP